MEEQTKYYVNTFNGPFLNTDCLVIQYDDVLQLPDFSILNFIIASKADVSELFDISSVSEFKTLNELVEWYLNRPFKELFTNFEYTDRLNEKMNELYGDETYINKKKAFSDLFIESMLLNNPELLKACGNLNFYNVLDSLMNSTSLVKRVIIFSKFHKDLCSHISTNLHSEINEKIEFFTCSDLTELLVNENISNNTTFVLSDVTLVNSILKAGKLDRSSILLSDGYKYNYNDDKLIVDIDELEKSNTFKFDLFNNFYD